MARKAHRRALRTVGAAWSRVLEGWIISAEAEPSVRAIVEPAGLTMEVREESDGVLAPMSYADRRAAKSERHERRAERLEARADARERKRGEAQASLNADPMYSDFGIMTEPIKVGHHSEGRHRRAKERVAAKMDKVVGLWREEAELRGRAAAAANAARPDAERGPAFMQRRIDEIAAELRSKPEHAEFNVAFPGGTVSVVRTTDGDYWAHVHVSRPGVGGYDPDSDQGGRIVDARLDIVGRHASETNTGDFSDPDLYHLAVRVTREGNGA